MGLLGAFFDRRFHTWRVWDGTNRCAPAKVARLGQSLPNRMGHSAPSRRCRRTSFVEHSVDGAARTAVESLSRFVSCVVAGHVKPRRRHFRSANSFSFAEVDFLTLCPPADLPPFFGFGI